MSCVCGKCGRTDESPAEESARCLGLSPDDCHKEEEEERRELVLSSACLFSAGCRRPLQKVLRPVARPHLEQEATRLCWQASSSRIGHISFISDGTLLEESSTLGVVAGGDPCGSLQRRVVQEKLADRVGHE